MIESFCRPDPNHWCIECCIETCCQLGNLEDGSVGCLSHPTLPEMDMYVPLQHHKCKKFTCRQLYKDIKDSDSLKIIQLISNLPQGMFKISEVISIYRSQTS